MNRIQKLEAEIQKLKKQESDKKGKISISRWKMYSHGAYFLRKNYSNSWGKF